MQRLWLDGAIEEPSLGNVKKNDFQLCAEIRAENREVVPIGTQAVLEESVV